jgi:uncharacterized membrane protein
MKAIISDKTTAHPPNTTTEAAFDVAGVVIGARTGALVGAATGAAIGAATGATVTDKKLGKNFNIEVS